MASKDTDGDRTTSLPVIEERLEVGKRQVDTGGVRLRRTVEEDIAHLAEPLMGEEVEVERVVRDQELTEIPPVRQEGDTTVIPVVAEEVIVHRRLLLKEEIRVTRRRTERLYQADIPVRRESVRIERTLPRQGGQEEGRDPPPAP